MPREKLRETLSELQQELDDTEALDESTRQLLESAMDDIHARLERTPDADAAEPAAPSFVEELREAVRDFEVSHPTLAGVIGRTIDLLAQSGI